MKSLKLYITESLMIVEKFACQKLRELVKKHGKVQPDSPLSPFGFYHDKNGVNLGRLTGAVIPHLTDEDFVEAFEKSGANFDNGDDLVQYFKKNVSDKEFINIDDISKLIARTKLVQKLFNNGYFWIVFKDNSIALFKVKNAETLKKCNEAIQALSKKFNNKKNK